MRKDDILTLTGAIAVFALIGTFSTFYRLSKDRFDLSQTWLMVKVLLITLGITAIGGCYWSDVCTDNKTLKDWLFVVGLCGLLLSFIVVPVIGGGLIGQAIGWCLWRITKAKKRQ